MRSSFSQASSSASSLRALLTLDQPVVIRILALKRQKLSEINSGDTIKGMTIAVKKSEVAPGFTET